MSLNNWSDTAPDKEGLYWLYGNPEFGAMGGDYTGVFPLVEGFHFISIRSIGSGLMGVNNGRIIQLTPFNEEERRAGWVGKWQKVNLPCPPAPAPPKSLSEAIDLALQDLEAVEKDPRYKIDMGNWHLPDCDEEAPKCYVCFAGAVMARTLNTPLDHEVPCKPGESFGKDWGNVFCALDGFRSSDFHEALKYWGRYSLVAPYLPLLNYNDIPGYLEDPVEFKKAMGQLAEECRALEAGRGLYNTPL